MSERPVIWMRSRLYILHRCVNIKRIRTDTRSCTGVIKQWQHSYNRRPHTEGKTPTDDAALSASNADTGTMVAQALVVSRSPTSSVVRNVPLCSTQLCNSLLG